MILIIAIREFKKLAKNYFARIYRERGKRKLDKIKARFALTAEAENTIEDAKKAVAYAKAAASLAPILAGQTPI